MAEGSRRAIDQRGAERDEIRLLPRQAPAPHARDDEVSTYYDSGDHRISGVARADPGSQTLTFSSQTGAVDLASLRKVG
ncbi:hypothetical protein [Methylobacterium sp. CM6257]